MENGSYSSLHIELQGETMSTMNTVKPMKPVQPVQPRTAKAWVRIPDGTKVKHRHEGHVGFIDGLTEGDLSILIDDEELVIMLRQKAPYRRVVTQSLHSVLAPDRFIKPA
jgi:hypothetical protein